MKKEEKAEVKKMLESTSKQKASNKIGLLTMLENRYNVFKSQFNLYQKQLELHKLRQKEIEASSFPQITVHPDLLTWNKKQKDLIASLAFNEVFDKIDSPIFEEDGELLFLR